MSDSHEIAWEVFSEGCMYVDLYTMSDDELLCMPDTADGKGFRVDAAVEASGLTDREVLQIVRNRLNEWVVHTGADTESVDVDFEEI